MRRGRPRCLFRGGDDRGAVAVEAALVTPLFIVIVFGIIEFGFVFKDWLGVTSAVRAGARIASAEPRQTDFAKDAAAQVQREGAALDFNRVTSMWVYKANSAGYPEGSGDSFDSCTTNCIQYKWDGANFVPAGGAWDPMSQDACQGEQDDVGVYLAVNDPGLTGLFFSHLTLASHTVMTLEPIPTLSGCKAESG
jgi:hypothetical protein